MAQTPDVIIDQPRKLLHYAAGGACLFFMFLSLAGFFTGGAFIGQFIIAVIFACIADRIKFRWVKQIEVGKYELV